MPTTGSTSRCSDPVRALAALLILVAPAFAETSREARERRPDLFHPETGYRIDRQRAPTPEDVPGPARAVSAEEARALIEAGAVAVDVMGAAQSRWDDLDGTWLVWKPRPTIAGAVWLPETGRGAPPPEIERYFAENLARLTEGDLARALVFFCVADCWMSWNAAQRAAALGYSDVSWFRDGVDGWRDRGWPLAPAEPVPVKLD